MSNYYELPQPEELTSREKEDAMGAYLMMFAAIAAGLPLPIINLIASVVYYFINKPGNRFVRFHSLQALLSSLPLTIMNAVGLFWGIRILFSDYSFTDTFKAYVGMVLIFNIVYYSIGIMAAIKARKGRMFYYWFFGKIAYHHTFKIRNEASAEAFSNKPPQI